MCVCEPRTSRTWVRNSSAGLSLDMVRRGLVLRLAGTDDGFDAVPVPLLLLLFFRRWGSESLLFNVGRCIMGDGADGGATLWHQWLRGLQGILLGSASGQERLNRSRPQDWRRSVNSCARQETLPGCTSCLRLWWGLRQKHGGIWPHAPSLAPSRLHARAELTVLYRLSSKQVRFWRMLMNFSLE